MPFERNGMNTRSRVTKSRSKPFVDEFGSSQSNGLLRQFGGSYYLFLPMPLDDGMAWWPLSSVVLLLFRLRLGR